MAKLLALLKNKYFGLQLFALCLWLGFEIAGYGTGVLSYLVRRDVTDADGWHISNLWHGAPPPGPIRLTKEERAAVVSRVSAAFNGSPPKHSTLSDLRFLYQPRGGLCDWRGANVASDPKECNSIKQAHPLFAALIAAMHPKTEILQWEEVSSGRGDRVLIAFFIGVSGKPQMLVDLSAVRGDHWDIDKGFVLKAYHGKGLTTLTLGTEFGAAGSRMYLVDDPHTFPRRDPACAANACLARLLVYGYDRSNTRDSLGKPVLQNIADVVITEVLEQRHRLLAAVMGTPGTGASVVAVSTPVDAWTNDKFGVTKFQTIHLQRKLDAILGAGATERGMFSPFGYRVAFGSVYGFSLDGAHYVIWDGGTPHRSLGTDRMLFRIVERGTVREVKDVRGTEGVHVLALPSAWRSKGLQLNVHKAAQPDGKPWSWFSEFSEVFEPLIKP